MANQALVAIIQKDENGNELSRYDLPEPSTYSGSTSTMVDEGTSVNGHLLGAVVRDDVAQVSLSWNYLSAKEWSDIVKRFNGKDYSQWVEFFDQTEGNWRERKMRIGDRSAGMHHRNSNGDIYWSGCSLQLTEV